jgi:hypothetical protein
MKNNTIIELENKIKDVKQKIEDVKSFKNLKLFSKVSFRENFYTLVYDPGKLCYGFLDKSGFVVTYRRSLEGVRKTLSNITNGGRDITLVGERHIKDLEEDLMCLEYDLKNAIRYNTPKSIKVSEAPDGWYILDKIMDGCPSNLIQRGDKIFIKNEIVYIEDHKRFQLEFDVDGYCIRGVHQTHWYGNTCIPM